MVRARYIGQPLTTHQKYELDTAVNRSCQTEDNRSNARIFFLHAACPVVAQLSAPATPASGSMTAGMDATGCACVCITKVCVRMLCLRSYVFVCVYVCVLQKRYASGTTAPALRHRPAVTCLRGPALRDWLCGSRPTRPACERGRLCETGLRDGLRDRPFFPQQAGPACEGLRGPHAFAMVESIWPLNCKVRFMFELNATAS